MRLLSVSRFLLDRYVATGELVAVNVATGAKARRLRITQESVDALIAARVTRRVDL